MRPKATSAHEHSITAEALARMPDPGPCELVRGRIEPARPLFWRHAFILTRLALEVNAFAAGRTLGKVLTGKVGLITGRDPDTVRGADVLFISHERLAEATPNSYLDVAPELVVEVLSPSNRWTKISEKIDEHFGIGVERVWIIEPERHLAQIYRSPGASRTVRENEALEGEGALDGFHLPLATLFEA